MYLEDLAGNCANCTMYASSDAYDLIVTVLSCKEGYSLNWTIHRIAVRRYPQTFTLSLSKCGVSSRYMRFVFRIETSYKEFDKI